MSRVDAILAVFTKTIAQLEKVARNNRVGAGFKPERSLADGSSAVGAAALVD